MKYRPTLSIYLEKRFPNKSGLYPVKIRVTYKGARKYLSCDAEFSVEEFENIMSLNPSSKYKPYKKYLMEKQGEVEDIIEDLDTFSWEELYNRFYHKKSVEKTSTVSDLFNIFIEKNNSEDRVGNSKVLKCARNSLLSFRTNLQFEDITYDFLVSYERWFLKKNTSQSTVGIYMRALRSIYNAAISDEYNLVSEKQYPFYNKIHPKGYKIPKGKNIKKALKEEEIEKIISYKLKEGSPEERARDFWYFTYLNNGINHKDICLLKYKDIIGDEIYFQRAKTIRSSRDKDRTIITILFPESRRIIEKWGNPDRSPENYVFPILTPGLSAKRRQEVQYSHLRTINKFNQRLARELKLGAGLTTMVARHTFASVMVENKTDLVRIQSMMGHSNITTTENYIKPFNSITRKETASVLLNHKKLRKNE